MRVARKVFVRVVFSLYMEIPETIENVSPSRTLEIENIGELYDYVIQYILEYTESDMEKFNVYELDDKSDAIRVILIGPKEFHDNRIETLHKRMEKVGEDQATVESIQINYVSENTSDGKIIAFIDTEDTPVEFSIGTE